MLTRVGLFGLALLTVVGCGGDATVGRTFDQEMQLTLKAGRGELTDSEKQQLLRENHPILAQVGSPQASKLVSHFASLPDSLRKQLVQESYVKWRLSDLDAATQTDYRELANFVIRAQLMPNLRGEDPGFILERVLKDAEVGFAVVDLKATQQKVVSWYVFGPQLQAPVWVTIVNSDASYAQHQDYVQAHHIRLPLLRTMKASSPPKGPPLPLTSLV